MQLIEAVQAGNAALVKELVDLGANVNEQDNFGWTPLNWAAGKGSTQIVVTLVAAGADPSKVGVDQRTPLMIALAAGHRDVAIFLREAQARSGQATTTGRTYCKAYRRSALQAFPKWSEKTGEREDQNANVHSDPIYYLHQDLVVTKSITRDEDVVFDDVGKEWKAFCESSLGFKVPDDLELIASPPPEDPANKPETATSRTN
jgi:ankyrin repeat protein